MPQWFNEMEGHLTKAGRAILAHHLMHRFHPAEEDLHHRPPKSSVGDSLVVLEDDETSLSISKAYESFWERRVDGDIFDLQINRHQLPDYWKKYFKKGAIEISGKIVKRTHSTSLMLLSRWPLKMSMWE